MFVISVMSKNYVTIKLRHLNLRVRTQCLGSGNFLNLGVCELPSIFSKTHHTVVTGTSPKSHI